MRDPVMRISDGWAYDRSVADAPAPTRSPHSGRFLKDTACVPHRLLRSLLALPRITPGAILQHVCPIALDAPLALPTMTLAGNTYSGAVYRWFWQAPGEGREPLTGDRADLAALQDDHTMGLLIDIAASEHFPAHRQVLAGLAPDLSQEMSLHQNMLGDTTLSLAAKYGRTHILQDLLSLSPPWARSHVNKHARTALGHAVANHHAGAAMLLIDAGAALGPVDAQGWTPWGRTLWNTYLQPSDAASLGMNAFYSLLHAPQGRSSIDTPMTAMGFTPMHIAANLGMETQVIDLFEAGANCDIPDAHGLTVRQMFAGRPEFTWNRF